MGIVVYNVAWAKTYLRTKWQLDSSSRLATVDIIDICRKVRVLCPILGEGWVAILHSVSWAEAYLRTKWYLDPSIRLATTDMA